MAKTATGQFDYGPIYGYVDDEDNDVYVVDIQAPFKYEQFRFPAPLCYDQADIGDYVRISANVDQNGLIKLIMDRLSPQEYDSAVRERGESFEMGELEAWRDLESRLQ